MLEEIGDVLIGDDLVAEHLQEGGGGSVDGVLVLKISLETKVFHDVLQLAGAVDHSAIHIVNVNVFVQCLDPLDHHGVDKHLGYLVDERPAFNLRQSVDSLGVSASLQESQPNGLA